MIRYFILVLSLSIFCVSADAQSRKGRKSSPEPEAPLSGGGPTSLNPNLPEKAQFGPKRSKKTNKRITYSLEEEYYQRMEAVAKQRQKTAKIMEKPQYSNPMYFGHKRMPKKRPAKKMRFCKECGIRH